MPESGKYGSVRGVPGNRHPYRDRRHAPVDLCKISPGASVVMKLTHWVVKLPSYPVIQIYQHMNAVDDVATEIAVSPETFGSSGARAIAALASLGQHTRLSIFRLLVSHEPCGRAVGEIAQAIQCPQNTTSGHLAILARAQLVISVRQGRSVIYRADLAGMRWLLEYLLADCCNGDPSLCATVFSSLCSGNCVHPATDQSTG